MHNDLFHITDLACSYTEYEADQVLHIGQLHIPRGELVFLLGPSGAGKSTLLETLALMNNTIVGGQLDFFDHTSKATNLSELWRNNAIDEIATMRKKHFSFIFQNTNLMENFTAYENICLSQMIKQQTGQEQAMQGARHLANEIGLPSHQLSEETLAVNLSGGQRQRLAFVRAINTDFTVVFGDEPTGNLDEQNAHELLRILKQHLGENGTAIIVSHDIDLAIRHADRIVVITKDADKNHGEIKSENVFVRSFWENNSTSFRHKLSDLYKTKQATITSPKNTQNSSVQYSKNHHALFLKKEGKALAGKQNLNFWILTAMLALTLIVIGFANGSIEYLDKKMNNAFVKWVNIGIPWGQSGDVVNLKTRLNQDRELIDEFKYEEVTAYANYPLFFWKAAKKDFTRAQGRSIDIVNNKSGLLDEILNEKNLIHGDKRMTDNGDLSLVVTQRFLDEFLPDDTTFIEMGFSINGITKPVPVPVRAVVKEIPGKSMVLYTLGFYGAVTTKVGGTFDLSQQRNLRIYVPDNREKAEKIIQQIQQLINNDEVLRNKAPDYEIEEHTMSYGEGNDIIINFIPPIYGDEASEIWSNVEKNLQKEGHNKNIKRIYLYKAESIDETEMTFDRLSLNFNDLGKVRSFSDTLLYNYERLGANAPVEVDMMQIKEKENFNFLSKITYTVAVLLVIFGVVSISLFLFNLLKMHLSKVKMNIGTLKAFGLHNNEAESTYFQIILRFLAISMLSALLLAALLGYGLDALLASGITREAGVYYFKPFHLYTLITLIILIIVTIFVSRYTIRKMLSKSPGDLIYGRE